MVSLLTCSILLHMLARPQHRRQMSLTEKCVCVCWCVCVRCKFLYIQSHTQVSHTFTSLCRKYFGRRRSMGHWKGVWVEKEEKKERYDGSGACSVIVVGRLLRILAVDCKWALCLPCSASDPCQQQPQQQQEQEQDNLLCCFWYGKNFLMMLQKSFALAPFASLCSLCSPYLPYSHTASTTVIEVDGIFE